MVRPMRDAILPAHVPRSELRPRTGGQPLAPEDVLVFDRSETTFDLVGGSGRGAGWAGIVEVPVDDSCLITRAWAAAVPLRLDASRPRQVAGPYHARHALAVPVGHRYVVVIGSSRPIELSDAEAVRIAASAIDEAHGVPADKLLADELELVQAIRSLMAYKAENVRDTLRHIATVAAKALSCDVAVIRVDHEDHALTEAIDLGTAGRRPTGEEGHRLYTPSPDVIVVEQASPSGRTLIGVELASQISVPIGTPPPLGSLVLGHATQRPRGFTSLCQRIARAVAEAAELLITQAIARERLASERDLLARISGTDALTGLANRRAWDDEAERLRMVEPLEGHVISVDLDGLKVANDRYGHVAGDALLRATANLLSSTIRNTDLAARLGGDEFAVLLTHADARVARRVRARIRRAERVWRITEHGLAPRLSIGLAPLVDNDLEAARGAADARMYANKRRRHARPIGDVKIDRRRAR
jgi:diguanylate cyclase (GGDEF)-like protein